MKLIKKGEKTTIRITKDEWLKIGKENGWTKEAIATGQNQPIPKVIVNFALMHGIKELSSPKGVMSLFIAIDDSMKELRAEQANTTMGGWQAFLEKALPGAAQGIQMFNPEMNMLKSMQDWMAHFYEGVWEVFDRQMAMKHRRGS